MQFFYVRVVRNLPGKKQLAIVRQLLQENFEPCPQKKGGRPSHGQKPARLTGRHFPSYVPPTEKKAAPYRQCHVCKNTTRQEQKSGAKAGTCVRRGARCLALQSTIN